MNRYKNSVISISLLYSNNLLGNLTTIFNDDKIEIKQALEENLDLKLLPKQLRELFQT